MADRDLHAVFAALQGASDPAPSVLCVGGCVRDALMDRPVVDVDLATVHPPDVTLARLKAAGIGVLGIGIEHGTVVARFGHKLFQITTLRVDVETDGRHARVAYTNDWETDASRRDFTMNALYTDLDGNVYDPLGGADDIAARRVRFIGDPRESKKTLCGSCASSASTPRSRMARLTRTGSRRARTARATWQISPVNASVRKSSNCWWRLIRW